MRRAEQGFTLFVLIAFLVADAAIIASAIITWTMMDPDFFGIWSTAQFLQNHRAADVYDITQLGAFQTALRPRFTAVYPAPYSPVFLLAIRPLAWLSYSWAHLLWAGLSLGAFAGTSLALVRRRDLAALLLAAPAITLNMVYGQTGFLSGALMLGALSSMATRPWLAGLCLALLTFKPQLGLLMPVMLLARRDWATIGATLAWLGLLVVLSGLALGWTIWPEWLSTLAGHGQLITESRAQLIGIMATITAAVLSFRGGPAMAQWVQLGVACAVAGLVWHAWRRAPGELAIAATLIGTFLLTPYAFVYDTPVAMCAALLFLRHCRKSAPPVSGPELSAVVFVLLAPLLILVPAPQPPAAPLSLLVLFAVIARRILQARPV